MDSLAHSPFKLLNGAQSVLVLRHHDDGLALVGSRRARPEWLGAIPLALLAALPLVGPGTLSLGRLVMALVLAGVALVLIVRALPRRTVSGIAREGGKVSIAGTQHEPLAIALIGAREDSPNSALSFQADLITTSTRVRVLEGMDPGVVADQAEELARFFGVPLQPGWGLDPRALSASSEGGPWRPEGETLTVVAELRPSQRAAGFTALGSTLFILCFSAVLLSQRWDRGLPVQVLSLVLLALIITFGFGVSTWLLGVRSELSLSSRGLSYTRSFLKRPLRQKQVPLSEIKGVFAVSPDGAMPTHVLSRVGAGWVAFPLAGEPARQLAAHFHPISKPTDRPAQRAEHDESTDFSGARTASG